MRDARSSLPLWPFIIVDVLFLALAVALLKFGHRPLPWQEAGLVVLCGALGAMSFLAPFLRRSASEETLGHAEMLANATSQIQKLDQLAGQISGATHHWMELQGHTAEASASAKKVAERIEAEVAAFTEFLQKTGESERAHWRLEVEKLRRAETERLQVLIRILDHVFALFQAARQSGQPGLIEQIGQFQNACLDAVRRLGLVQVVAQPGEPFDDKAHQLPQNLSATPGALIASTIGAGYTYQGQVLRRPLVALQVPPEAAP